MTSNRHPKRIKRKNRAHFPPELITEILSRLPVKSLLKFKSISKPWRALISSREFIKTHLSLSANKKEDTHHLLILGKSNFKEYSLRSLFYDSVTKAFDLDYSGEYIRKDIRFEGSCNGLVLLADYSGSSLLWNPSTRMHKKLPDFRPKWERNSLRYGFGYDEVRDDYKVVGISSRSYGLYDVEVKVYSLKSDSWTSVDVCGETFVTRINAGSRRKMLNTSRSRWKMLLSGSCVFANGKLHWDTTIAGPSFSSMIKDMDIVAFDLANEKWEKIEKPFYEEGETHLGVGTLGSDLCVFRDHERTHVGAWVMNECGVEESWIKKFTIKYPPNHPPSYKSLCTPLFMSNKGEILVLLGSTFMIYNSKDDSFKFPYFINCDGLHDAEIYIESLVCPFSSEGTENAT